VSNARAGFEVRQLRVDARRGLLVIDLFIAFPQRPSTPPSRRRSAEPPERFGRASQRFRAPRNLSSGSSANAELDQAQDVLKRRYGECILRCLVQKRGGAQRIGRLPAW